MGNKSNTRNKVLLNILYNFSYQVLILILPVITIPYVSRVLSPEGIGINAFTLSIVGYFALFGNMGISTYGNREIAYYQHDIDKRSQIFWELIVLRFITFSFSTFTFIVFLLFTTDYHLIYILQFLSVFSAVLDVSWYFMGMENFRVTVLRNTIVRIIAVVLTLLLVKNTNDLWVYVLINTGTAFFGNLVLLPYLKKEVLLPKLGKMNIQKHVKPSLQLFLPQIAIQIYVIVNKNMIGVMDSITAAGYFDQADKIVKMLMTVSTSIVGVFMPRIANLKAEEEFEEIKKLTKFSFDLVTLLATPMFFGLIATADTFVPIFFGEEYMPVVSILCIEAVVILLIAWSGVLGNQYMVPMNMLHTFTITVSIGAVSNILANMVLIPIFGVNGATVATVISEIIVTATQLYFLKKVFSLSFLYKGVWKIIASGVVMFLGIRGGRLFLPISVLSLIVEISIGGVFYFMMLRFLKINFFDLLRGLGAKK